MMDLIIFTNCQSIFSSCGLLQVNKHNTGKKKLQMEANTVILHAPEKSISQQRKLTDLWADAQIKNLHDAKLQACGNVSMECTWCNLASSAENDRSDS